MNQNESNRKIFIGKNIISFFEKTTSFDRFQRTISLAILVQFHGTARPGELLGSMESIGRAKRSSLVDPICGSAGRFFQQSELFGTLTVRGSEPVARNSDFTTILRRFGTDSVLGNLPRSHH